MTKRFYTCLLFSILLCSCSSKKQSTSPAPLNSSLPSLYTDDSGNVLLSWVEPGADDEKTMLKFAQLNGDTWSSSSKITSGSNWFVNWADYPSVISKNGVPLAAHWLQKVPGNSYAYHVNLSINQGNKQWSPPITPHRDSTATEHGFVSMMPWADNNILAIWLDGRKTSGRMDGNYADLDQAMTLRSAVLNKEGKLVERWLIDENVCDCCNTSLAGTQDGAIAVYRNRVEGEIRDIYVSKLTNNKWSKPQAVSNDNWDIAACPVNGPKVAVKDSTVLVAWFTGADGKRSVKAAISNDLAATFAEPIIINDTHSIGRVDAAISDDGQLFVSWMKEDSKGKAQLNITNIRNGKTATYQAAMMSASRKSGFPQMEAYGNKLVLAWTHFNDQHESSIKTAIIPIAANF